MQDKGEKIIIPRDFNHAIPKVQLISVMSCSCMDEGGGFRSVHMFHYIVIWSAHKEHNRKEKKSWNVQITKHVIDFIYENNYSINFAYADESYTTVGSTFSETIIYVRE